MIQMFVLLIIVTSAYVFEFLFQIYLNIYACISPDLCIHL